jgi:hypothetical protein
MRLNLLIEGITEDAALRVFSRLVTTTNGIAELLERVGAKQDEDLTNDIESSGQALKAVADRISQMGMSQELWKSIKTSIVTGQDLGNSWMEFQSIISRRLVPEIILSLSQLTSGSIENIDAKLAMAKERVQNLQEIITGIAPATGGVPQGGEMDPENSA